MDRLCRVITKSLENVVELPLKFDIVGTCVLKPIRFHDAQNGAAEKAQEVRWMVALAPDVIIIITEVVISLVVIDTCIFNYYKVQ